MNAFGARMRDAPCGVPPQRRVPLKGKDHKETVGFLKVLRHRV